MRKSMGHLHCVGRKGFATDIFPISWKSVTNFHEWQSTTRGHFKNNLCQSAPHVIVNKNYRSMKLCNVNVRKKHLFCRDVFTCPLYSWNKRFGRVNRCQSERKYEHCTSWSCGRCAHVDRSRSRSRQLCIGSPE